MTLPTPSPSPAGNCLPWTMRIRNFRCVDQIVIIALLSQNWIKLWQLRPPHKCLIKVSGLPYVITWQISEIGPSSPAGGSVIRAMGDQG